MHTKAVLWIMAQLIPVDALGVEAMKNFITFFRVGDDQQQRLIGTLRVNFIVWFLRQNVDEMFHVANKRFEMTKGDTDMFIDPDNWAKMVKKVPKSRSKVTICLMYQFGVSVDNFMQFVGLNTVEWVNMLHRLKMDELINANPEINCDDDDEVEKFYQFLIDSSLIDTIVGFCLDEFLKVSDSFRHFFCHENDMLALKIAMSSKLVFASNLVQLEDEFPEVLRIDILLATTLLERCRLLLMYRSNSAQFRKTYAHWVIGWLIGELRRLRDYFHFLGPSAGLSARELATLRETVDEQCSMALDEMQSERQMCVLERLHELLMTQFGRKEMLHRLDKRLKKQAKAEECADERRRADTLDQFKRTVFSKAIVISMNQIISQNETSSEIFLAMLNFPGAKTRLLKLMGGNKEIIDELEDEHGQLKNRFYEKDVFLNDNRLSSHYHLVLAVDIEWFRAGKLGADLVVFMRWMKRMMAERGIGTALYDKMRIYVEEHIYDPLLDGNEEETKRAEKFLKKLFFYTKNLLEILPRGDEGGGGGKSFWKKWSAFVAKGGQKMMDLPKQKLEENWQWMGQLHLREFVGLMEGQGNTNLANFISVLRSADGTNAMDGLCQLFDQQTIVELFRLLHIDPNLLGCPLPPQMKIVLIEAKSEEENGSSSSSNSETEKENGKGKAKDGTFDEIGTKNGGQLATSAVETENVEQIGQEKQQQNSSDWESDEKSAKKYLEKKMAEKRQKSNEDSDKEEGQSKSELIECPPKSVPVEMLRDIDRANNNVLMRFLLAQLMEFLPADDLPFIFINGQKILLFQMYAVIWYLTELAAKLILSAAKLEPLEDDGQRNRRHILDTEVAKLSRDLAQLRNELALLKNELKSDGQQQQQQMRENETDAVEMAIFKTYKFVQHIALNKQLTENGMGWHEIIGEIADIELMLVKMDGLSEGNQWKSVPFDGQEMRVIYSQFVESYDQILETTFYFVDDLFARFTELQRFFCAFTGTVELTNAKWKLSLPIGKQNLSSLEKLFPDILHFDVPLTLTVVVSLKAFLAHKFGTDQSQHAEALHALPLSLEQAKEKVDKFIASGFEQLDNGKYGKMWHSVRRSVFKSLAEENGNSGQMLHSLCTVHVFSTFMDNEEKSLLKMVKKRGIVETERDELNKLDLAKCARSDVQQQILELQRTVHVHVRVAFLDHFFENNTFFFANFMKENRGARNRIKKMFGPNFEHFKKLVKKHRTALIDPQMFHIDKLLPLYLDALFGADIGTLVVGKLSVFIAVLVRWMDAELLSNHSNMTVGLRQVGNMVWKPRTKPYFEDMFDELIDDDFDELERKSYLLKELIKGLLQFVDQKRHERDLGKLDMRSSSKSDTRKGRKKNNLMIRIGKNVIGPIKESNLAIEWQQMEAEALARAAERRKGAETEEEQEEQQMISWLHHAQWDTIVELLENEWVREQLKIGFILNDEAKERLTYLVSFEMANEIVAFLNLATEKEKKVKIKEMKKKYGKNKEEKEKKDEKEQNEQKKLADKNMREMIREEEKMKELKVRREQMQREKQKKKAEERERERERREKETSAKKEREENEEESSREREEKEMKESKEEEKEGKEKGAAKRKEKGKKKGKTQTEEREESETGKMEREKEAEEEQSLESEMAQVELDDFRSDNFLASKYFDFLKNPSKSKKQMLDIGAFINEIQHRIETIEKISKSNGMENSQRKIGGEKKNLKKLMERHKNENGGIGTLEIKQKLCGILKRIATEKDTNCGDESTVDDGGQSTVEKEIKLVQMQLHKNKMAKTIIGGGEKGENGTDIWPKMTKSDILNNLFETKRTKANSIDKFNEHIENWRNLLKQQNLDKKLSERFSGRSETERENLENLCEMHENLQQIYFQGREYKTKDEMLHQVLEENGYGRKETPKDLMEGIERTILKWSNGDARLIVTGSHLLDTQTPGSDIDTICIMPQKLSYLEEKNKFFGNYIFNCHLNDGNLVERKCGDDSLFCQFCKNPKLEEITKISSAYIQMLQLKMSGVKFDISLVLIPGMEYLPDEPLDSDDIEWMMEVLANQQRPQRAMLRTLSSYLANKEIIGLLNEKNQTKFRALSLTLKFWAKSNYIYGNVYGFFNGISLSILATKIILLYPNASVLFLFEQLLFIFTIWNWPMPVKLSDSDKPIGLFEPFSWNISQQETLTMPIITPSFLSQNCTYNINKATFKIIQKAMRKTLFELKMFRNEPNKNSLTNLFTGENFTEKYQYFVTISCIVNIHEHITQFCQFVERKIRLKIANFDEMTDQMVEFGHLKPTKEMANGQQNECPATLDLTDFTRSAPLCKIWLIGLKLNDGIKNINEENEEKINEKLSKELDAKIYKEYESEVLKGLFQHVRLKSTFVTSEQLAQWNIGK
ncbi:hypothetical protein niasHT_012027 [Heterodera trifolii]|uniref:polynucleotide adenylyltransferase n=1 Tax=Heterodera trifolii TaxID=157864 RepID=A0ABD2KUZ7_9BILA